MKGSLPPSLIRQIWIKFTPHYRFFFWFNKVPISPERLILSGYLWKRENFKAKNVQVFPAVEVFNFKREKKKQRSLFRIFFLIQRVLGMYLIFMKYCTISAVDNIQSDQMFFRPLKKVNNFLQSGIVWYLRNCIFLMFFKRRP